MKLFSVRCKTEGIFLELALKIDQILLFGVAEYIILG